MGMTVRRLARHPIVNRATSTAIEVSTNEPPRLAVHRSAEPTTRDTPARRPGRIPAAWLDGLPPALVAIGAALLSFGTALLLEHLVELPTNLVILAVVLAVTLGRRQRETGRGRLLTRLVVLPVVAVASSEVGIQLFQHPDLGDTLFVVGVTATIWGRRFGPIATRVGTLATLPLIATLITPVAIAPGGSSADDSRWWAALIAVVALFWVTVAQFGAERLGFLPRATERPTPPPAAPPVGAGRRRLPASTKMALQMGVSLAAAFVVGRTAFSTHWTWVVITAFIVCSGNRGRADVLHKGVMRIVGAAVGTLTATGIAGAASAGNPWSIVAIFALLALGLWLRTFSYAYWAGCVTSVLALLYGYYGESGNSLLVDRLVEILIGAAIGVAASWVLLPIRTSDVARKHLAAALAGMTDFVTAIGKDPAHLARHQARVRHAVTELDRTTASMRFWRFVPRRGKTGHDHVGMLTALEQCFTAMRAVAWNAAAGSGDASDRSGHPTPSQAVVDARDDAVARIIALRRANGDRGTPRPQIDTAMAEVTEAMRTLSALPWAVPVPTVGTRSDGIVDV